MGLLDNYTGIGMSPRPARQHQHVMANLLIAIREDGFYALTEECINENDRNSPAPDLVIFTDEDEKQPFAIIEITTTKELKAIKEKVQKLCAVYSYIQEAFIYNYEKKQWYCAGANVDPENPSFSQIIDADLNDYL